jgi:hypothetical protein
LGVKGFSGSTTTVSAGLTTARRGLGGVAELADSSGEASGDASVENPEGHPEDASAPAGSTGAFRRADDRGLRSGWDDAVVASLSVDSALGVIEASPAVIRMEEGREEDDARGLRSGWEDSILESPSGRAAPSSVDRVVDASLAAIRVEEGRDDARGLRSG